jgi:hypothetical protein
MARSVPGGARADRPLWSSGGRSSDRLRLAVEIKPFARATAKTRRSAADEAERLSEFLGGALALRWS